MEEKRLIDVSNENVKAVLEKYPYYENVKAVLEKYPDYPDEVWKFTAMTEKFPTVDAVELPCKIGDTVYQVDANKIYPVTIKNLIYDAGHIAFDKNAVGKSVFLTRKEAEAKLDGNGNG